MIVIVLGIAKVRIFFIPPKLLGILFVFSHENAYLCLRNDKGGKMVIDTPRFYNHYFLNRLYFEAMRNQRKKRNTPVCTLIRNYVDKKSGKVSVSREELKWRFNYLDWKDQKKILAAFLDSCLSDREWAYSKALDYWDDSFLPKVRELWETYHEYRCSWSVIRYFPLDYVREHIAEFTEERDYYFICLRLAKDKDYVIDRAKLSDTDYLALVYHTQRSLSDDDARDTLFRIVHDCCLESSFMPRLERVGEGRYRNVVTPANYHKVRLAIYYLLRLEKDEAVQQFEQWNEAVEDAIYDSPEFKAINRNDFSFDFEYDSRRVEVANIYAYQALDERYKQPSDPAIEQMRQSLDKALEWAKMRREQPIDYSFEASPPDFNDIELSDGESLPF